jgi:CRISPR-associated protein Cmr2
MTAHLIAISVGPVQEFIAAARRTRDLWFGSYLLSEISKATAKAIQQRGSLIFPAPEDVSELEPGSPANVANVIVADLGAEDPADVALGAKKAARARWRAFADRVRQTHAPVIDPEIWNDQVDDVIEVYAAWRAYTSATYRDDRAALMRALQARKRCRDFLPAKGRAGVWKSSLDGLRESVLVPGKRWPERSRRRFHLSEGEQLDVVGAVKRVWAPLDGTPRYPSVARVAADPWLRGIPAAKLAQLTQVCRGLGSEVLHEIEMSNERGQPHYASFPFEGTAVYRSRHRDLQNEAEISDEEIAPLTRAVTTLMREHGDPSPYLAVLLADGDRMGEALSKLTSPEQHREFSRALAGFATGARQIVADHRGVLVYAGGDDVLGFVPVDRGVACARALRDRFGDVLQPWAKETGTELTLSVGIAVAHFMEPFEDLLAYARTAERHAKSPRRADLDQRARDGLAVHVVKRGDDAVVIRANWSTHPEGHLAQLVAWLTDRAVPSRAAHDLHAIARLYDEWSADTVKDAIQRDALSVMRDKQPRAASQMAEIEKLIRKRVTGADALRGLANELFVAQQIATSASQDSALPAEAVSGALEQAP